ncbi:hypothetical protein SSP24_22060 [Streptomyces spinoverrucosus]|uniref:Secreted protein n=1 Tax=Streptomyces spinoverrucosus TaxID=284043 RepID=A0A4Y3VG07_9ACTN|nr:hypothetical protein [Streptomyces spinoverrucosus]GEC04551.1 hypothetical protein SSP24_22060 [Streptomyces spinoverrucosus]GHB57926.1 hypothetical protein GCM10010397_30310 [Streptomyces spinoverrucosus]
MTRRTKKVLVTASVLAAAGLAGGGVALAADGDEAPREQIRFVVEEGGAADREDCPWKDSSTVAPSSDPASAL